jgi:hypothetical protein
MHLFICRRHVELRMWSHKILFATKLDRLNVPLYVCQTEISDKRSKEYKVMETKPPLVRLAYMMPLRL